MCVSASDRKKKGGSPEITKKSTINHIAISNRQQSNQQRMLSEDQSRQQVSSTEIDGGSVPLSLQTGQILVEQQADMQTFMSPASQDHSNYSSAFGGGEESEQRRN